MNPAPETPEALRKQLSEALPTFVSDWNDPAPQDDEAPDTFHGVMREFTYSYGKLANSLTPTQLRNIANIINGATEEESALQNAVATCFLEHLHQVRGLKALWPYLSQKARAECHP